DRASGRHGDLRGTGRQAHARTCLPTAPRAARTRCPSPARHGLTRPVRGCSRRRACPCPDGCSPEPAPLVGRRRRARPAPHLAAHDINYYLAERPPELRQAVALAGALLAILAALVLGLLARWILAVPEVVFGGRHGREALAESARATRGHRRAIALGLAAGAA